MLRRWVWSDELGSKYSLGLWTDGLATAVPVEGLKVKNGERLLILQTSVSDGLGDLPSEGKLFLVDW